MMLITGGSGYFGSLLLGKCAAAGIKCRVFDIHDVDDRPPTVEFVRGDIRDSSAVRRACEGVQVIHHNVAQVPLAKDRHLFESVNITGTQNVLEAALAFGVKKVVFTSSSAIYGVPKDNPVTEESPPAPAEAYGRAKLAGERLCVDFARKGLDVTIIRPRTILGHGRLGIFQILYEWVCEGANVPVLGRGDNRYQFVHADDLADACILAAERPGATSYNIGTNCFGTMRETLEALCAHAATGSRVVSVPMALAVWAMNMTSWLGLSPLGPYHALMYGRSLYFDTTKAQRELGWRPRRSNVAMMIESYEWYLQNRREVLAGTGRSHHRSAVNAGVLRLLRRCL